MTNLEMITELTAMTKRFELLSDVLKKKNANYYTPENITKEENDLIYNNIKFFDAANWDVNTIENVIASNKKVLNNLIKNN